MAESSWRRYLRFWRPNLEADVDDELRFHFDERTAALTATGLSIDEARRQAEREFGDVGAVRNGLREIDGRLHATRARANHWDQWRQDFTYSARSLRRVPGLSFTVILTLALGIGVNATLFSLLDRVFLRMPAGVSRPAELRRFYWIGTSVNNQAIAVPEFSIPVADGVADVLRGLAVTTVFRNDTRRLGDDREPSTVVTGVGPRYFSVLGVQPSFGRFFAPDEARYDVATPVAVVSQAFWSRRFGGSPADAIGQTIVLDKQRLTIIGVAPRHFTGTELDATDAWVPLGMTSAFATFGQAPAGRPAWYQSQTMYAFLLLARPVNASAAARLEAAATVGARRWFRNPRLQKNARVLTGPIIAARGPEGRQQEIAISVRLGGVALIVLFIACANVANLLLAHAMRRRREIAVRAAVGISRGGIVRLVLADSVLLALGAGIAAFLVASWSSVLLRRLLFPTIHWSTSAIDWRVVAFTLVATLVAGLGAGLLPALRSTRTDVSQVLKSGGREGSTQRSRARTFLVVAQAALSTVLLVGALLFVKSLRAVRALDLGYDAERLVFVSTQSHGERWGSGVTAGSGPLAELASRLAHVPGVEKVALTSMLPMYEIDLSKLFYANGDSLPPWTDGAPTVSGVSPEFFATTGLHLLRGRLLTPSDLRAGNVAVVNQTLARSSWPNDEPLGQCLRLGKSGPCATIVGIVEDARRVQLIERPVRQMYLALRDSGSYSPGGILVRVPPERAAAVEHEATRMVATLFPGVEANVRRMADVLAPQYRPWELGATLFTIFGLLALLVAAVGVFSTLSHEIGQRRHELGVRVALGATVADIIRLVLGEGLRVIVIGAAVGSLLALAAGRLIASLLYGVDPRDLSAFATVVAVLLVVAATAAVLPAWRASRTDPLEAIRAD
jgi:putative ABC transport system permease protein